MAERSKKDPKRGNRLRELRLDDDRSAIHVAREIGVSKGRVYAWEDGDPINSENLDKLAEALGTTRSYILSGEESDLLPVEAGEAVRLVLQKMTEAEARQTQIQSDLGQLVLEMQRLRADLQSSRRPDAQGQGGQG